MSLYNVEIHINPNTSHHHIYHVFLKTGERFLAKNKYVLVGFVEENSVWLVNNYPMEAITYSSLVKKLDTDADAIEFAKQYFSVTKVVVNE